VSWNPPEADANKLAVALLDAVRGPKDLKRLGAWLETEGDAALRQALVDLARKRGVDLPDEAVDWPGKRLLRRALAREEEAQRRTTPIARDEAFVCAFCNKSVPPHGRTARDHCPWCLRSKHVDEVPGDRASTCGGRLDPHDVLIRSRSVVIRYRCTRCGAERVNQAVTDGEVPDDWEALVRLSSGTLA
jgi:hypothetical protein